MKKSKYIFGVILSLALLGGCKEEMPSLGTASATSESAETPAEATTAVPAKNVTETSAASEKSENFKLAEKTVLENHIKQAAGEEELKDPVFDDLDGDGSLELIALCGYNWWYTNGKKTSKLVDCWGDYTISIIDAGQQKIAALTVSRSRLYIFKDGEVSELDISRRFGSIEKTGDNIFEVIAYAYDESFGYTDRTEKIYWLYFEDGQFKEYVGEKITKADFINYGGKSALDGIEGEVTDILRRENGVVNVNYTEDKDGVTYNKYKTYDVTDGCKEIAAGDGIYLPSVLDPFWGLPEEQLALHRLIADTSENKEGSIHSPIFGDFDGDGINEVITLYGTQNSDEVWFASKDKAELIAANGIWLVPQVVNSCGKAYIKMEYCAYATSSTSNYFLIRDSSASEYSGAPGGQDVYPYGSFGDFTAVHGSYDGNMELYKDEKDPNPVMTGHTWKTYWYYVVDDDSHSYSGRLITEEEFLKYDGAKTLLDKFTKDGETVTEIIKRGCGIINVNLKKVNDDSEDYFSESYSNKTLLYRSGKLYDITDNYDHCGNYVFDEKVGQTDFERFSEMIYDTAEGDENSFIRERFYGSIDGKKALYAYYGTEENHSLWYADKDGAKKVTENIELFCADGDVLMKRDGDYFVVKNGKSKKLDIMGAENFTMQPEGFFTGYVSDGHADSQKTEKTKKTYWFRYRDGEFRGIEGLDITAEEFLEYVGGRAFLDEIAARGGDLVNIVRRANGIININYALHNQTVTQRFFMTLQADKDGRLTDITPKKEDGTPDNAGWYLHSLKL